MEIRSLRAPVCDCKLCVDGPGDDLRICEKHYDSGDDNIGRKRTKEWLKHMKLLIEGRDENRTESSRYF